MTKESIANNELEQANNMPNKIAINISISVGAQLISLLVSFVLNLIVPKFIPEYQYSLWHVFLLYVGYVGVLHFGLLDGMILRYSKYNYEELDKKRFQSQFNVLLFFLSCSSVIITCFIALFVSDNLQVALLLVVVGVFTKNIFGYTSQIFQITNRIDKYALVVISQRVAYMLIVIFLLVFKVDNFLWFCLAEIFGDFFGFIVGVRYNKGLYCGKGLHFQELIKETRLNISSGFLLMIANLTSLLLVGSAKMIIQWRWDDYVFGKVSFAFSVSNLFLSFVTAISIVLFPSLKRMEQKQLPLLYKKIRDVISPLLFFAMILYFPCEWILGMWLPAYQVSLTYLGILLPIILFSSKVSLLTNNYLKAYRKEKDMLVINLFTVILSLGLYLFCAYLLNDLTVLLLSVVLMIMVRSIISEICVAKIINTAFTLDFIVEAIMTVSFVVCAKMFSLSIGALIYSICLAVYILIYRKNLKKLSIQLIDYIRSLKRYTTK